MIWIYIVDHYYTLDEGSNWKERKNLSTKYTKKLALKITHLGVDIEFLDISGYAFCEALDSIEQHKDLWSPQVDRYICI